MSPKARSGASPGRQTTVASKPVRTRTEISAGGVVFRKRGKRIEVALISVGDPPRWQLPKGLVDRGERPEETAVREVREETGVESTLVAALECIGYWYQRMEGTTRVRVRKFVHFFLLKYRAGRVTNHDHEVLEARWASFEDAGEMLAFASERNVLAAAAQRLQQGASR